MMRRVVAALVVAGLLALLAFAFRGRLEGLSHPTFLNLLYMLGWLVLLAGGLAASRSGLGPHWLRNAALWAVIFCAAMGIYALKDELADLLDPSAPRARGAGVELRRGQDGHFWADAKLDGVDVRMMVDTGASEIALTPSDARRIGVDVSGLAYTTPVVTAQGEALAAPVMVGRVQLGAITVDNVPAEIMRADGAGSLLGMSFLNRLSGYEVRRDKLELEPPR